MGLPAENAGTWTNLWDAWHGQTTSSVHGSGDSLCPFGPAVLLLGSELCLEDVIRFSVLERLFFLGFKLCLEEFCLAWTTIGPIVPSSSGPRACFPSGVWRCFFAWDNEWTNCPVAFRTQGYRPAGWPNCQSRQLKLKFGRSQRAFSGPHWPLSMTNVPVSLLAGHVGPLFGGEWGESPSKSCTPWFAAAVTWGQLPWGTLVPTGQWIPEMQTAS